MTRNSPMARLRRANPVPVEASAASRPKLGGAVARILLVISGMFAIGFGAAWAASGENPVSSIFKKDIRIVESDSGLDSFSVLKPMTQEEFDALPRDLALRVHFAATTHTIQKNLAEGRKPFANRGRSRSSNFRPLPAAVSSIGHATASTGREATVMVVNGELCVNWDYGRGPGSCGSLERIAAGDIGVSGSLEGGNPHLWRILGVVPDGVASIVIQGSTRPPMPIRDNVFEFRKLRTKNLRLIALDRDGREVFRTAAPLASWAELGS